jgi:tetratricopeptide (TPR) repeat protein
MIGRQPALTIVVSAGLLLFVSSAARAACPAPIARVVSIDNSVQIRDASGTTYAAATLNAPVCQGDTIRVGEVSRATIAFLDSGLRLTIEQNTEFAVQPPRRAGRSYINLLRGAILFFTRQPRSLDVRTPFVNAAVEGTEFLIRVEGNRAEVAVLEGTVALENDQGNLILTGGQSGQAVAGQAPQRIDVRPDDAVRWALYYEPILSPSSLAELDRVPPASRDAAYFVRRASALLSAGRADEARAELARGRQLDPNDGDAHALTAIIDIAQNNREGALENGRRAVALAPQSVSARLALSYALQAGFDLDAARDELIEVLPSDAKSDRPEHALALAHLAELWLSLGYVGKALDAANRAVALVPDTGAVARLARPHMVLGFVELARVRTSQAKAAFERAIVRESTNPLAHLGLGLAKIREGELGAGRHDIETAAALDVKDAIIRSYLGKAYFEERRDGPSAEQLDLAKQLDPRDPTAYLYDAIRKQTVNRPVEALADLQRSIELNDNRAVYRSRFLLDSDLAARSASLGRIYRDLGFEQLALVEGWKSLALDPGDFSAHRLLADTYAGLPRHTIARDSELLQAQLLQPLNISPVQPRLADNGFSFLDTGPAASGFNEFTRLFAGNQLRFVGDGLIGNHGTKADNLILSGIYNRLSFSVGQFHTNTDGIRENNDADENIYNAFLQTEISAASSVQIEFRATDSEFGDRRQLFFPENALTGFRASGDSSSIRLGGRHTFAPGSVVIGSYVHRTLDGDLDTGQGFAVLTEEDADFGEVRYLHKWRTVNFTAGAGHYAGGRLENRTFGPIAFPPESIETRHSNGYIYADVNMAKDATVTLGVSHDDFRDGTLKRSPVNPKLGVIWRVDSATTVRGAAFNVIERTLISGQTIEPTEVAGFNQFFYDTGGTVSRRYGVALDRRVRRNVAAGGEVSLRKLRVPAFEGATGRPIDSDRDENLVKAYLHSTPVKWMAITAQYQFDRLARDAEGNNEGLLAKARTHRLIGEGRVFARSGAFGTLRATFADQDGRFVTPSFVVEPRADRFWTLDAAMGYRFPRQHGVASLEIRNALDKTFQFQDSSPEEAMIVPARQVLARLTLAF